jgi:hypothetical protein
VKEYVSKGMLRLSSGVDLSRLDVRIIASIPKIYEVYKKYADG